VESEYDYLPEVQQADIDADDYTEGDKYDWDHNDSRQYCKHGTFIGSWWGPDLMCMECELGD
jgi:hypothetical protein